MRIYALFHFLYLIYFSYNTAICLLYRELIITLNIIFAILVTVIVLQIASFLNNISVSITAIVGSKWLALVWVASGVSWAALGFRKIADSIVCLDLLIFMAIKLYKRALIWPRVTREEFHCSRSG